MLLPTHRWAQQIQAKTAIGSSRGSSAMRETPIQFLAWEVPLEKGTALPTPAFLDSPGVSEGNEPACNTGDLSSFPWLGRSPGGRHDNPFQYSCLENSMDRGAWQAIQSLGSQRVRQGWMTKHTAQGHMAIPGPINVTTKSERRGFQPHENTQEGREFWKEAICFWKSI